MDVRFKRKLAVKPRLKPVVIYRSKIIEYFTPESRENDIQKLYIAGWRISSSKTVEYDVFNKKAIKYQVTYFK